MREKRLTRVHFEKWLLSHLFPAELGKKNSKNVGGLIKQTNTTHFFFFPMKSRIDPTTLNPETTYLGSPDRNNTHTCEQELCLLLVVGSNIV